LHHRHRVIATMIHEQNPDDEMSDELIKSDI